MRLRPYLVCLLAVGALSAAAPAARAQDPVRVGVAAGLTTQVAVGFMSRRDTRNGLNCLNYYGGWPTRTVCGLKARRRFYEAARSPERPIGPVSWIGPGYDPPVRPPGATRIATPSGCGAAGQIAPCGLAPMAPGYGPYNSGYRR